MACIGNIYIYEICALFIGTLANIKLATLRLASFDIFWGGFDEIEKLCHGLVSIPKFDPRMTRGRPSPLQVLGWTSNPT